MCVWNYSDDVYQVFDFFPKQMEQKIPNVLAGAHEIMNISPARQNTL